MYCYKLIYLRNYIWFKKRITESDFIKMVEEEFFIIFFYRILILMIIRE